MTTTKKISELPSAVTPLQGTETIPIVQDGATRRATTADIVAGKADTAHTHSLADLVDAGTAAESDISDFATAAQGTKADTAVQPGDLVPVATTGAYSDLSGIPTSGLGNIIINGCCRVSQRGSQTLTDVWGKTPIDLLMVKAEGTVTAGTIQQATNAFTLTETGHACFIEDATITGAGALLFRRRIEAKDCWKLAYQPATYSARIYHDYGTAANVTITLRKANAVDDFSSVTDIASTTVSVAHDTNADISLSVPTMGDCRNGIEVEVRIDCGAITAKDTYLAQEQLAVGDVVQPFLIRPLALEHQLVSRYLQPAAIINAVASSASTLQATLNHPMMRVAPNYELDTALAMTDGVTMDATQSQADIGTVHDANAHRGRVDLGYFSGLTVGTHYLQRGTGGTVLASAEL